MVENDYKKNDGIYDVDYLKVPNDEFLEYWYLPKIDSMIAELEYEKSILEKEDEVIQILKGFMGILANLKNPIANLDETIKYLREDSLAQSLLEECDRIMKFENPHLACLPFSYTERYITVLLSWLLSDKQVIKYKSLQVKLLKLQEHRIRFGTLTPPDGSSFGGR